MEIKIGNLYRCHAIGVLEEVTGTIIGVYDKTVVINVEEYEPCDKENLVEKQNRVIVRKENILYALQEAV